MSTKSQQKLSISSLAVLALAFITAVIISNQLLTGVKIDLTENNLYTLSDGTVRILENIEEPVNLYFYYSDQATAGIPSLRSYANRVREMLEEFEDIAGGNIILQVIDPLPFSEDEDRAAQFGLQGVQLGTTPDPVYLGLAGTDTVDNVEIISFFQPDKESFLEYDIARLVSGAAIRNPEPEHHFRRDPGRHHAAMDRPAEESPESHALCNRSVRHAWRQRARIRRSARGCRCGADGRHAAGHAADGPGLRPAAVVCRMGPRILRDGRGRGRTACIADKFRDEPAAGTAFRVSRRDHGSHERRRHRHRESQRHQPRDGRPFHGRGR
jgi:hypothetical protein